jgi:hypothetical protein
MAASGHLGEKNLSAITPELIGWIISKFLS